LIPALLRRESRSLLQYVESGSTAIATKVVSGDQIVFGSGGGHGALAVSATIGPHGDQSVAIGGTALDTTLFGQTFRLLRTPHRSVRFPARLVHNAATDFRLTCHTLPHSQAVALALQRLSLSRLALTLELVSSSPRWTEV
jgi:hypothetical protein